MRVAYVLGTSAGGTVRHVRMLADGLTGRGVDVCVYAPAATWMPDGTPGGGVPFAAVESSDRPRPAQDLAAVRRLRGLLARSRPDVVHAHGLRAGALAALAVGRGQGRPALIVTVHNAAPSGGAAGTIYRVLEHLVARRADRVLCVSSDLEERMRRLGARHVAWVPISAPGEVGEQPPPEAAADIRASLTAGNGQAGAPVVLAVGRLAAQKGLGTLIEAASRWQDRSPVPVLAIAGDGPLAGDLARQSQALGVAVTFLGHRDDVPALLAAADVVVAPSMWEGQPLLVHEILRAGRPLVASRVGGIPDLTGQDAALLVPAGDPAALADAVLAVLDDPAQAARLSQAALRQAKTLPTEQDALEAALAAYTVPA
ncbi:MAG TPA: glycosyltransferase family 4 protein [Streptosporangiaceae bacterium]|jgi:glycosyltransferase involved in cell wall biosynthesis